MITVPGWVVALVLLALALWPWIALCLWLDRRLRAVIHDWLEHRFVEAVEQAYARLQAQEDEPDEEADHG